MTVAGTPLLITGTFSELPSGEPQDPTTVALGLLNLVTNTTVAVPSEDIVRVSVGVYTYTFDTTNLPGQWVAQWQGTGALLGVSDPEYFDVDAPVVSGIT